MREKETLRPHIIHAAYGQSRVALGASTAGRMEVSAMTSQNERDGAKDAYVPPAILATYDRQALEETVQPQGQESGGFGGCGCGCGCGS